MSFADQVYKFRKDSLDYVRDVKRAAAYELFAAVVMETPVREGILRGSWHPSINVPQIEAAGSISPDKSGNYTLEQIRQAVRGLELEEAIYLVNNQPYAARIEYDGWSGKAPQGMVRVNAARWVEIVGRVARELAP